MAQTVKNLPAMQETQVRSLGQEDPLEKGMTTHSSILVWRIPWTKDPGGLQSVRSQRVRHDWVTNIFTLSYNYIHIHIYIYYNFVSQEETHVLNSHHKLKYLSHIISERRKICIHTHSYLYVCVYVYVYVSVYTQALYIHIRINKGLLYSTQNAAQFL